MKNKIIFIVAFWSGCMIHGELTPQEKFKFLKPASLALIELIDSNRPITPEEIIKINNSVPCQEESSQEEIDNTIQTLEHLRENQILKDCYAFILKLAEEIIQTDNEEERQEIKIKAKECYQLFMDYAQSLKNRQQN